MAQKELFATPEVALIFEKYRDAMKYMYEWGDFEPLKIFKRDYDKEYKFFSRVARQRATIMKCVKAMKVISTEIYFGTLTYKHDKDKNKEETKRKEAFEFLNSEFKYFVLVEENGEDNGRYHIHFVGVFRLDHNFNSFINGWHSRQNLEKLRLDNVGYVAHYMCKYLAKDTPRVRKNKNLIQLIRLHKELEKRIKRKWLEKDIYNALKELNNFDFEIDAPF